MEDFVGDKVVVYDAVSGVVSGEMEEFIRDRLRHPNKHSLRALRRNLFSNGIAARVLIIEEYISSLDERTRGNIVLAATILLPFVSERVARRFVDSFSKNTRLVTRAAEECYVCRGVCVDLLMEKGNIDVAVALSAKLRISEPHDVAGLIRAIIENKKDYAPEKILVVLFKHDPTRMNDPNEFIEALLSQAPSMAANYMEKLGVSETMFDIRTHVDRLIAAKKLELVEELFRNFDSIRHYAVEALGPVDKNFRDMMTTRLNKKEIFPPLPSLPFPLPKESIIFVCDEKTTMEAEELLFRPSVTRVGLDAEWKPTFGRGASRVSILQVACEDYVFIFDLLFAFSGHMEDVLSRLFRSDRIMKIGMAFDGDLKELRRSYPSCESFDVVHPIIDVNAQFRKCYSGKNQRSLSSLVAYATGCCLNKKERMSNWELRPLRPQQLEYAALDALCLMTVVDVLDKKMSQMSPQHSSEKAK
eukprot:TRINITY_DN82187_c0_g1_i1.p1 TRINITY_DN82187_c0_g1~~TRINITY_DN82187_c0_g1_i1.p1  ORF type:complete len:473 (-),score=124.51 TRINITY_DN82187_c0_g1_i1:311-1729(-)